MSSSPLPLFPLMPHVWCWLYPLLSFYRISFFFLVGRPAKKRRPGFFTTTQQPLEMLLLFASRQKFQGGTFAQHKAVFPSGVGVIWSALAVEGKGNWGTVLQQAKHIKFKRPNFCSKAPVRVSVFVRACLRVRACVRVCECVCTVHYVTTSELSVRSSLSFLLGMSMPELCIDPWSISWFWEKSCISLSVT